MLVSTASSWLQAADRYASVEGGAGEEREEGAVGNLLMKKYCRVKMIKRRGCVTLTRHLFSTVVEHSH